MPNIAKLNPAEVKLLQQWEQELKSKGQDVVLIAYENNHM